MDQQQYQETLVSARRHLIGLTMSEAEARWVGPIRVIKRDGVSMARTMEYRPDRVNVVVQQNYITKIEGMG